MLLEIIQVGLAAIADVSTILRNMETSKREKGLVISLRNIQSRVSAVEDSIMRYSNKSISEQSLIESYNTLLQVLRSSHYYCSRLEFVPTDIGTWKLVTRNPKNAKKAILRDPEGEF